MYLETTQIVQLSAALLATIVMFVAAYATSLRTSVAILLVLIPFQPLDTSFGSANVVVTYVLAGALMLRGRLRHAPLLGAMLAVVLAYLITISRLPRGMYVLHGIEIVMLVSGFLVFVLTYNLAREENPKFVINLLIWTNVLAVIYCLFQLTLAPGESLNLFGIEELSTNRNRGEEARLVGPFGTPGMTAAYLMSMTIVLMYQILHSRGWPKRSLVALAALNVGMIIATANRGSFLILLAAFLVFLYLFRAELGLARMVQILVASAVILVAGTAAVMSYTDYGLMLSRLETTTELENGVPATRSAVWPLAWENIKEKPFLGHGPRLVQQHELKYRNFHPDQFISPYPHNLYLHLLVTVGLLGAGCMLFFLFGAAWRIYQGARVGRFGSAYERGWGIVGVLVIGAFFLDELKIEFLRDTTEDYAHFVFALFGIFLGWADAARARARSKEEPTKVAAAAPAFATPALRTTASRTRV
jgi:O-antigen ligase